MTVAELLDRISSRELSEWMAYARIEPFGEQRADYHAALIAATIANANRAKGQPRARIEDFLIFREEEEPTPEGLAEKMRAAMGHKVGNDEDA